MAEPILTPDMALSPVAQTTSDLFATYPLTGRAYDEAFDPSGAVRPHWDRILPFLNSLGVSGLSQHWAQARRMIHDNGVTYHIYNDSQAMERLWELDAIPWAISSEDWRQLETGLIQRAHLLNAILADVYGPDTLLEQGLIPPELIYGHSGFLRPCHNVPVPNDCYLHFYAADIGRAPDGSWWVLSDRAQSPAGMGYALENRLILSNVLADLFRECQVEHLAPFFAALRQTLIDMAPRHRDNPRIVLLSPGPYDESYFEDTYLAPYLGFTLVEGDDLTVRDQTVFLKTLAGLQPVDVILRRVPDQLCDSLELQSDSVVGVAGLVQAVRAENVAVANSLGSGWLESAALMPLLPSLSRHLLGEELLLPSVPTWWGGHPEGLTYMLEHMAELILAPALPTHPREVVFGDRLSQREREQFAHRVRARPHAYAAQESLMLSELPVWDGVGVQPQQSVLRVYVVATQNDYVVMPGGLARVSAGINNPLVSMQNERGSKDTWVLAVNPPDTFSLLPAPDQPILLRRSGYDFPSRAADNLFWMGRYAERAEGLVRFLRSLLVRLVDDSRPSTNQVFPTLIQAMIKTWKGLADLTTTDSNTGATGYRHVLVAAMFDPDLPSSVRASLSGLRRVAALVRDYMTLESWRIVTQLEEHFTRAPGSDRIRLSEALELLDQTIMILSAFSGLGVENMIRGPEWHFLDMGRRLARSLYTASVLRQTLVEVHPQEVGVLEALLEFGDSSITYRSRYLTRLQCAPVLDLLLTDDTNPRALLYQLVSLAAHVDNLPRNDAMPSLSPAQRLAVTMLTDVRLAEIDALCQIGRKGTRPELDALLGRVLTHLPDLSDHITYHYLSHSETTRHLAHMHRVPGIGGEGGR